MEGPGEAARSGLSAAKGRSCHPLNPRMTACRFGAASSEQLNWGLLL
jgi:hypothetical protein